MTSNNENEYNVLLKCCRELEPPKGDYRESDFIMNLMLTVLDYQLRGTTVSRAKVYFEDHHSRDIKAINDLKAFLGKYPDDKEGNRMAAKALWGYFYGKRIWQLRRLIEYFIIAGVTDQEALRNWAKNSDFKRDFQGEIKGLAYAVYQWLIMRQGVETIKPDIHIKRFLYKSLGRNYSDEEAVDVLMRVAVELNLKAYKLDWSIWEHQRRKQERG